MCKMLNPGEGDGVGHELVRWKLKSNEIAFGALSAKRNTQTMSVASAGCTSEVKQQCLMSLVELDMEHLFCLPPLNLYRYI